MALSRTAGDDLFSQFFSTWPALAMVQSGDGAERSMRPITLDVVEKPNNYQVKADIPGVDKNDIKLSVDHDVLSISVEKKEQKEEIKKEEGGVTWHRWERSSSYARRSLRMPEAADLHAVKAKYENGVLSLEIPKTEKAQPKTITID